jgi:predicted neutral ceramidase superfamily lipid hydrolase
MRDETDDERFDRNLAELLQEVRVAQNGVQILFAFLLTLPFAQRFTKLSDFQVHLYYATLCLTAVSTLLMIAPVAYHRVVFQRSEKENLVRDGSRLTMVGLGFLALGICCGLFLVVDFIFGPLAVVFTVGGALLISAGTWVWLPLWRMRSRRRRAAVPDSAGVGPKDPSP